MTPGRLRAVALPDDVLVHQASPPLQHREITILPAVIEDSKSRVLLASTSSGYPPGIQDAVRIMGGRVMQSEANSAHQYDSDKVLGRRRGKRMTESKSIDWARAERAAQGITDGGVDAAVRCFYTRVIPVILLIGAAINAIVIFILDEPVSLTIAVFGTLAISAMITMIYSFVYVSKKVNPLVTPDRASVLMLLNMEDSKRIRRQITGAAPVEPDELVVSRGAAVQMLKSAGSQLLTTAGQFMFFAGATLYYDAPYQFFWLLLTLAPAIALTMMFRHFRKILRFLKETEPKAVSR